MSQLLRTLVQWIFTHQTHGSIRQMRTNVTCTLAHALNFTLTFILSHRWSTVGVNIFISVWHQYTSLCCDKCSDFVYPVFCMFWLLKHLNSFSFPLIVDIKINSTCDMTKVSLFFGLNYYQNISRPCVPQSVLLAYYFSLLWLGHFSLPVEGFFYSLCASKGKLEWFQRYMNSTDNGTPNRHWGLHGSTEYTETITPKISN